jgi:hypothetical protein
MKELVEYKTTKCFDINCKEMEIIELNRVFLFFSFNSLILWKKGKISQILEKPIF